MRPRCPALLWPCPLALCALLRAEWWHETVQGSWEQPRKAPPRHPSWAEAKGFSLTCSTQTGGGRRLPSRKEVRVCVELAHIHPGPLHGAAGSPLCRHPLSPFSFFHPLLSFCSVLWGSLSLSFSAPTFHPASLPSAILSFSLGPWSQPPLLAHFPISPCVPALGDPLPVHHYFHGYLAGFSVRSGRLESREVIECLYACREGLDYRDFESLGKGMKVQPLPSPLPHVPGPTPSALTPPTPERSAVPVLGPRST